MSGQNQIEPVHSAKRRGRGCLLSLGRLMVVLLVLIVVGTIYESAAEAADMRAYPPPGQMVDVGGYRLHINCTADYCPGRALRTWATLSKDKRVVQTDLLSLRPTPPH